MSRIKGTRSQGRLKGRKTPVGKLKDRMDQEETKEEAA
jgi:hypothetical protein